MLLMSSTISEYVTRLGADLVGMTHVEEIQDEKIKNVTSSKKLCIQENKVIGGKGGVSSKESNRSSLLNGSKKRFQDSQTSKEVIGSESMASTSRIAQRKLYPKVYRFLYIGRLPQSLNMRVYYVFLILSLFLLFIPLAGSIKTVKTVEYPVAYVAQPSADTNYQKNITIQSPDGIEEIISLEFFIRGDYQASTDVKGRVRHPNGTLIDCNPSTWSTPSSGPRGS